MRADITAGLREEGAHLVARCPSTTLWKDLQGQKLASTLNTAPLTNLSLAYKLDPEVGSNLYARDKLDPAL